MLRVHKLSPAAVLAAIVVAVLLAGSAVQAAQATVPPRNCKIITVGGKRYNIKADQIRCPKARTWSATYLRAHRGPSGYRCRDIRGSRMVFRCLRGDRSFFAIRR